jgi:hypothetical protein
MKSYLSLLVLLFAATQGFGQYKYEREFRIKNEAVPEMALNFVHSMNFDSNIKWYKEQGFQEIFFEAKTKYKGQRYSIKFKDNGTFFDLEVEVTPDEIPEATFRKMEEQLQAEFSKFSIEKIQIQYTGKPEIILAYFQEKAFRVGIDIHYEVVISTKRDGAYTMFEFLFSEPGDFVQKAEIILKSIDNIIY